ncbi:MAG: SDR family oxidoreductase [Porticoccaceae bacterium]|jgi:NAD(P)-dependent dehydrogenase (short-subunit alcohol dehydrogenase family)|nr:SDR family oxidoreductase [Porticoccaceae bacterium]MBT4592060.1 SDR family oxidoreductase [Porticoccaceae bacterium]MBT5003864.1 SDR family oxidoreductase [Porticoccaceae bacterium]MBT6026758.1 SDR family oxidoreductase [Porticoccaceae bacterium]MBT6421578.1 SDR family oxidoreductase [Porticoccaceae bacterium]
MKRLEGKRAVVLGAATNSNMGQIIARRLTEEGAKVLVSGRNEEALKALSSELGSSYGLCDITNHDQVRQLAEQAQQELGTVDIAINTTGWGLLKPVLEITDDELDGIVNLQFKGVHYFLAEFVRVMIKNPISGGSLINISSATTKALVNNHAAYIGTKTGAEALIRCVANDYGQYGIRANSISPALTKTPMTEGNFEVPGLADVFMSRVPLSRLNTSDDVAAAAVWLSSDEAFVTGENVQINGGLTMRGNPQSDDIQKAIAASSST